jgi:guanylate kinase
LEDGTERIINVEILGLRRQMSTSMPALSKGPVFIVSGPSGSGKSTVIARLLEGPELKLHLSVSATTRSRRPGEKDGVHYHFWTKEKFERERAAGNLLEWAEVHGNLYGTLKEEVEPYRAKGVGVVLDIDVQGREQVCRQIPDALSIFLMASAPGTYEERLRKRGTESEESIQDRLEGARRELAEADSYEYQVRNDDLDSAVTELRAIVRRHCFEVEHA